MKNSNMKCQKKSSNLSRQYLLTFVAFSLLNVPFIRASNIRGLVVADPELDLFECNLLVKVIRFEDGSEQSDLDCELNDNSIVPFDYKPAKLQELLENGTIESGRDILVVRGGSVQNDKVSIPLDVDISIKKRDRPIGGRRLAATTGIRKTIALWIQGGGSSTSTPMDNGASGCLTDEIFGTYGDSINLRSQYNACSFGQLDFEPFNGVTTSGKTVSNGVFKVSISNTISGASEYTIVNAVKTAGNNALGDMRSQFDHVMLCLPPGTRGGWIAYAYIDSYLSVYNDKWCNYVSAQLHEIGHNLNLAHSGEGDSEYDDKSGMMGYSYSQDEAPEMCFNAPKNWQLGWYSQNQVTLNSPYSWSGNLYGIADYGTSTPSQKMIIRLDDPKNSRDIYVSFNKKSGVNKGTVEGGNQVLVHSKKANPVAYGESKLLAKLSAGKSYVITMNGKEIPIIVKSIGEYAQIIIGKTSAPTLSPTYEPSNSPSFLPTITLSPSYEPSNSPSFSPTKTNSPSKSAVPTSSMLPSSSPTLSMPPSNSPTLTVSPSNSPSMSPTTKSPTKSPSETPTKSPTKSPVALDCSSISKALLCNSYSKCSWNPQQKKCLLDTCVPFNYYQCNNSAKCSWDVKTKQCSTRYYNNVTCSKFNGKYINCAKNSQCLWVKSTRKCVNKTQNTCTNINKPYLCRKNGCGWNANTKKCFSKKKRNIFTRII